MIPVLAWSALLLLPACPPGGGSGGGGLLRISDATPFTVEGPRGGPFEPASRSLTLRNAGSVPVDWSAELDAPWLDLVGSGSSLAPGASAEITLRLDEEAAAGLAPRTYAGVLVIQTDAEGGGTRIDCLLDVLSEGWTPFERSPDTRAVYVSSSEGDDRNEGLSERRPKRTLAAGKALLRSGSPDWLLLKRGDTWNEPLGQWIASGRSASERMLITGYGEGDRRPLLLTGSSNGIETFEGGNSPGHIDHVALVGIHMRPDTYAGAEKPAGVAWLVGSNDFLIEDCLIEGYHTNVLVQGYYGRHSRFQLRRSVIADAFTTSQEPSSHGLYLSNSDDVLVEENVFDHNGWSETVPGAAPSIYRHNIYVQSGSGACTGVVVRGNILASAASHGLQLRPGGIAYGNLFLRNSIAMMLGGGNEPNEGGVKVAAVRNVILDGKDIDAENPRGWGIEVFNVASGTVSDNIIAHDPHGGRPIPLDLHGDAKGIGVFRTTVSNNVIWDWRGSVLLQGDRSQLGEIEMRQNDVCNSITNQPLLWHVLRGDGIGVVSQGNRFHSSSAPADSWFQVGTRLCSLEEWTGKVGDAGSERWEPAYPDPGRTIATYSGSLGGAESHEGFMKAARGQSRASWREEYTARAAIEYFRQGFGLK